MLEQYAKATNLSCLLNADKEMELIPEPFRMQRNVIFRVTYSEYINYVLSLAKNNRIKLLSNTGSLVDLALTGHPLLYNHFLEDMAFAIIKELYFAEFYRKRATVILPAAFNQHNINLSSLLGSYPYCVGVQNELLFKCAQLGFNLPKNISEVNLFLYKTAVILYSLSKNSNAVEEVNLVYDLAV